jgi:hypothetical protein
MEELFKYIKNRILETRFDELSKNKDGSINQSELEWYASVCLEKIVDTAISRTFDF